MLLFVVRSGTFGGRGNSSLPTMASSRTSPNMPTPRLVMCKFYTPVNIPRTSRVRRSRPSPTRPLDSSSMPFRMVIVVSTIARSPPQPSELSGLLSCLSKQLRHRNPSPLHPQRLLPLCTTFRSFVGRTPPRIPQAGSSGRSSTRLASASSTRSMSSTTLTSPRPTWLARGFRRSNSGR